MALVTPEPTTATRPIHLGRQAIYDDAGDVVAYELLYRHSSDAVSAMYRDSYATAQVLLSAWTEFGRTELIGERPAFINLTDPFVHGLLPIPLSPSQVAVEIQADSPVDDRLIKAVGALAEREFTIVLDDFRAGEDRNVLLPFATYCKVDFLHVDGPTIERVTREIGAHIHVESIAYRLEDPAAIDLALSHGFRMFQGNGLGYPHVLTTQVPAVDPHRTGELLAELARPEPDRDRIIELVTADAGLAFGIRRAAGSDTTDGCTAATVAAAIDRLGMARVAEWAQLIRFVDDAGRGSAAPVLPLGALIAP
jgi:c-di-GMP-related signal transduction protein